MAYFLHSHGHFPLYDLAKRSREKKGSIRYSIFHNTSPIQRNMGNYIFQHAGNFSSTDRRHNHANHNHSIHSFIRKNRQTCSKLTYPIFYMDSFFSNPELFYLDIKLNP